MNNEEIMALSVLVCERRMGADANVEYTLPEYFPEIRKLLRVHASPLRPTGYASAASAQVNGVVDYRVIYVGSDGEIYSAPTSAEYAISLPLDADERTDTALGLQMTCNPCVESTTSRVGGPRRISIRTRIKCNVRVFGKSPLCEELIGEVNPMSIYKRREVCESAEYGICGSELVELECDMSPLPDGTRIVDADVKAFVQETGIGREGVFCRGEITLSLLREDENSREYVSIGKKLPFECNIETDGLPDGASVCARGIPSEVRIDVEEDRAVCKIAVNVEAKCLFNKQVEYTSDLYSSERECSTDEQNYLGAKLLLCKNANVTLSERLASDSVGIPSDARVIAAFGSASVDGCRTENEKYIFDGSARIAVICEQSGEFSCTEIELPIRYETDGEIGEAVCFDGTADVISLRATNENSSFGIDAEIALSLDCVGLNSIVALDCAEFGESIGRDTDTLTVCYPAECDTLWSVAKRYRVAPSDISGDPAVDRYVIIE